MKRRTVLPRGIFLLAVWISYLSLWRSKLLIFIWPAHGAARLWHWAGLAAAPMRACSFQQWDGSPSSVPGAAAVPGQLTSMWIPCAFLTVAAGEGSCSIQSCWHHTRGYVCMLSLDQGGNTAVWWVDACEAFHGNLWKILDLIFLSGFLFQQFTAERCVFIEIC